MVPDDDLFPTEDAPTEGAPAGGEAPAEDSAGLTREDVQGYTDRLEDLGRGLAEQQQNNATIAQALQGVNQTLERLGLSGNGESELDSTNFLTDPEGEMKRVAGEIAEQKLREMGGPLLAQQNEFIHQNVMAAEKANIAAEFGDEAWDKVFAPTIDPIIQRTRQTAPSQLGNADAIRNAIDSRKGNQFAVLSEMRKTAQEGAASAAEQDQKQLMTFVNSNLSGGMRRAPQGDVLTDEMRAFLDAEERDTGQRPDEKEFLRSVNSGATLSDFQNAQPKEGA